MNDPGIDSLTLTFPEESMPSRNGWKGNGPFSRRREITLNGGLFRVSVTAGRYGPFANVDFN
ncbi:MAG: hypothetical protein M3P01_10670, partial [Actinomycetota bacterium]|nr:hypothetical protein [Actinomycetota bacterium]